jgi:hypothetical protein
MGGSPGAGVLGSSGEWTSADPRRVSTGNSASAVYNGAASMETKNTEPAMLDSTVRSPPSMRASEREMAKPSPVPPNRRVVLWSA